MKSFKKFVQEESEQLDELSPNTLHSYIKKSAGNMAGNAALAAAQASSSMRKSSPEVKRNIKNRMKGITSASGRLADKANMAEEVELDEGLFGGGKKIEDHHYTLINTDVNKRVGHGTVWKTEAGAKNYHKGRGADWQGNHMKVMTVGDAKKRGVPEHNFNNLAVSEEVELDEISKKLAKSYLNKSAAEREANPQYSTREKFRSRMIGGATADAKLKGRVQEPYKFGQAPKRKMYVKVKATNEEVELDEASDLRITKIYNKKNATYAVHSPDRKYFKEFDNEADAKKHLESKKS